MKTDIPFIPGDMPGDTIHVTESHAARARIIYQDLIEKINKSGNRKIVVSVYGGSGVGKSEIAAVLAAQFSNDNFGAYVLSGDNYPIRMPEENDRERENRYRYAGLAALARSDAFSSGQMDVLRKAWKAGKDADPKIVKEHGFLHAYQEAGRRALKQYLGTPEEIDFSLVNSIIHAFKKGDERIALKRMGRIPEEIYFETIDFSALSILMVEWTHGNSRELAGVDFPVFLYSTPAQTLEYRVSRARDKGADSPFVSTVLEIEQDKLNHQAATASIIVGNNGEIIAPAHFLERIL